MGNINTQKIKESIKDIPKISDKRLQRNTLIYNYIKENPLTSCYKISKKLKISYALVHQAVKEFLFAGLVEGIDTINEFGRPRKLLVIPEVEKK
ncbi:MAG: hypothetical protein PVG65_01580 [Candidatus Thorarchaeota archaeon]|jgi:hypothetical protein